MKTTWKVAAAAMLISGGIWAGSLLNEKVEGAGVTNQPGTADDPVVTKSYVDQQIQQALKGEAAILPRREALIQAQVPKQGTQQHLPRMKLKLSRLSLVRS